MGTVTMEDIARRAGVSRALVSMAFRDVPGVSAATRDHILATADAMGYRFNRLASRLARKAATTFGCSSSTCARTSTPTCSTASAPSRKPTTST